MAQKPKRVVLGICGSIAAYKAGDIIRRLQDKGCGVEHVPVNFFAGKDRQGQGRDELPGLCGHDHRDAATLVLQTADDVPCFIRGNAAATPQNNSLWFLDH